MPSSEPSPKAILTEEVAIKTIRDFFRDTPFVFFGTGMSCALDIHFGMPALEQELSQTVSLELVGSEEESQWLKVTKSLQEGEGLETALGSVTDSTLLRKVTSATAKFVSSIDRKYALKIMNDEVIWPAANFFKRLVDTLPEGDPILHVLTPNYDTLFEHACDAVGVRYTTGFSGGLLRRIDWNAAEQSLVVHEKISQGRRLKSIPKFRKHARLYKVHGSLNLFLDGNTVVENNAWMWDPPDFARRVIITPGLSKYRMLQNYRQELLARADVAIEKSNRFLFLGYGFNDIHLEAYIKKKLIDQGCKGLILTRGSNIRIESLLKMSPNLWLICKSSDDDSDGTRIFNKQYAGWLELPERRIWDIRTFTMDVLGGQIWRYLFLTHHIC